MTCCKLILLCLILAPKGSLIVFWQQLFIARLKFYRGNGHGVMMDRPLACCARSPGFDSSDIQMFCLWGLKWWGRSSREPTILSVFGVSAIRKRKMLSKKVHSRAAKKIGIFFFFCSLSRGVWFIGEDLLPVCLPSSLHHMLPTFLSSAASQWRE